MNVSILKTAIACILLNCLVSCTAKDEWTSLMDKDLSQWEMYLSYEHKPDYNGSQPLD